jgi:hypothetical protein
MRKTRNGAGYAIAEMPAVLYALFILMVFPLLDLAAITLRYAFCTLAVNEAAMDGATCKTFQTDSSATEPSAQTAAGQSVDNVLAKWNGIVKTDFHTRLVVTQVSDGQTSRQETKLNDPADTNNFMYMIEPELKADVHPLVTVPFFGMDVPGLTGPIHVDVAARKYAENPQGLNQ